MTRVPVSRRPARAILAAALALAAGCGIPKPPPNAPDPAPPPAPDLVEQVYPASETIALYDTGIWVVFKEALDPATINENNIFLKLDTQRVPVTLVWDAAARRLSLAPRAQLALRRTYTVEVTERVRTAAGEAVGSPFFWQFKTNSLRRPIPRAPFPGTDGESPFAALGWDTTEIVAGYPGYRVWVGDDSATVAGRTGQVFDGRLDGYIVPFASWGLGRRLWWTVTARNSVTGEFLDGPVASFETLPVGTPVDSVVVPAIDWGYSLTINNVNICRAGNVLASSGRGYNGIRWRLPSPAGDLRLAGARLLLIGAYRGDFANVLVRLSGTGEPFSACRINKLEHPTVDGALALGELVPGGYVRFQSDFLTAHLEAAARYGRANGYTFQTGGEIDFTLNGLAPGNPGQGGFVLYRYRPAASPALARSDSRP